MLFFCGTALLIGLFIVIPGDAAYEAGGLIFVVLLQCSAVAKALILPRMRHLPAVLIYAGLAVVAGGLGWGAAVAGAWFALGDWLPRPAVMSAGEAVISLWILFWLRRKSRSQDEMTPLNQAIRHHFLFNALNTTVCLIPVNPARAIHTLESLSELFRQMLYQKEKSTLQEEINMTRRYIELERTRLGGKVQTEWHINCKDCRAVQVPTMILQPLIENAVYHGIETLEDGDGLIKINVEQRDQQIVFAISNPIGPEQRPPGNVIAQKNIEKRLSLHYGKSGFHFAKSQSIKEYRVKITIPLEGTNDKYFNRR